MGWWQPPRVALPVPGTRLKAHSGPCSKVESHQQAPEPALLAAACAFVPGEVRGGGLEKPYDLQVGWQEVFQAVFFG